MGIRQDVLGGMEENQDSTSLMDSSAGRTSATSKCVYGIPTDQLGMLSTQIISLHKSIDDLWQTAVLGLLSRTSSGCLQDVNMTESNHSHLPSAFMMNLMENVMHGVKNELIQEIVKVLWDQGLSHQALGNMCTL
jgi:hypothetical protein